jgi:hypothetical protein
LYISPNKISSKLVNLFSDIRITQNQWKFDIPDNLIDESVAVIATAKNLADGINYAIERHNLDIPEKLMVVSREYQERISNNGELINDGLSY